MKCPECGFENREEANFCKKCGASLREEPTEEEGRPIRHDKQPEPESEDRQDRESSEPPADSGTLQPSETRHRKGLGKRAVIVAASAAAVVALLVMAFISTGGGGLADRGVLDDFSRFATTLSVGGGFFDGEAPLEVVDSQVLKNDEYRMTEQERLLLGVGEDAPARIAVVQATMSNGYTELSGTYTAYFIKQDGTWLRLFDYTPNGTPTYAPVKGPDEKKVVESASSILGEASRTAAFESSDLSDVYENGEVTVTQNTVEGMTANVVLHCRKESDFFVAEGDVTAKFVLVDGRWGLDSAQADDAAARRDYSKAVGTWTGEFLEQDRWTAECHAAKASPLTVTIDSYDAGTQQISGTFTGLVHYHRPPDGDVESFDGDEIVENVPFTASIDEDEYIGSSVTTSTGAQYTTPKDERGEIRLTLAFGTIDDPSIAYAELKTMAEIDPASYGKIGLNYTAEYPDVFKLTRAE